MARAISVTHVGWQTHEDFQMSPITEQVTKSLATSTDSQVVAKDVVLIKQSGRMHNYIAYVQQHLSDMSSVKLIADGAAISKAVSVAEIVKRADPALHQTTVLKPVSSATRIKSRLTIQLTRPRAGKDIDMNSST